MTTDDTEIPPLEWTREQERLPLRDPWVGIRSDLVFMVTLTNDARRGVEALAKRASVFPALRRCCETVPRLARRVGEVEREIPSIKEVGGDAVERLGAAVLDYTRRMLEVVRFDPGTIEDDGDEPVWLPGADAVVDGMLVWDARFADFIEGIGPEGKLRAEMVRSKAREAQASSEFYCDIPVWRLWSKDQGAELPVWVRQLAIVLWADVVREQAQTDQDLHSPALPFATAHELASLQRDEITPAGLGRAFAVLAPASFEVLDTDDLHDVSPLVLDAVITYFLSTAYALCCQDSLRTAYDVKLRRGKVELCELLELRSHKESDDVGRILTRMSKVFLGWNVGGWRGSPRALVTLTEMEGTGGRGLVLGISPVWTPRLVHLLGDNVDKRLVPWVKRPDLGAVGGRRLYPKALQLFRRMLVELTEHAHRLAAGQYAPIDTEELGREMGLDADRTKALIASWTGEKGPFARSSHGFRLAERPELEGAAQLLLGGGELRRVRSVAGKTSARIKRERPPKAKSKSESSPKKGGKGGKKSA